MSATMTISLNGAPHQTDATDLAALLRELRLEPERVVAELDGLVVPKADFARSPIREGSVLELLRFVGGG